MLNIFHKSNTSWIGWRKITKHCHHLLKSCVIAFWFLAETLPTPHCYPSIRMGNQTMQRDTLEATCSFLLSIFPCFMSFPFSQSSLSSQSCFWNVEITPGFSTTQALLPFRGCLHPAWVAGGRSLPLWGCERPNTSHLPVCRCFHLLLDMIHSHTSSLGN